MSANAMTMTQVTAGEVAGDTISADARAIVLLFDEVMATAEPDAVHACRVAVRRLRADVRTFRPLLDRAWVGERRRDLHSLHRTLATIRHLDVRAGHLRAAGARVAGRDDEVAAVQRDLADVRRDAVAAIPVTLTDETRAWLVELADDAEAPPVHPDPGSDAHVEAALVLPALLKRPWRQLREARKHAVADDEQLRIWSRRCRYAAEAMAQALGPPAADLADAAAALHVALGDLHEAVELQADARALHDAGVIGARVAKALRAHADDLRLDAKPRGKAALAVVLACEDATTTPEGMRTSIAGGGVVWRPVPEGDGVELVVVHRPRKGDWSLPKGRLRPGEDVAAGALREVEEETGLVCRCEDVVAASDYVDRRGRRKVVQFWAMRPVTIGRRAGNEVDEVRWLPLERAIDLVDKRRDRDVLVAFGAAAAAGPVTAGVTDGTAGDQG